MPAPETRFRFQDAVLWRSTGIAGDFGRDIVEEPEELKVRWINELGWMNDPRGNTVPVDAKVHVDTPIAIGSQMWLGTLSDYYGSGSDDNDSGLMYVVAYTITPDIRNRAMRRLVGLQRFRDEGQS